MKDASLRVFRVVRAIGCTGARIRSEEKESNVRTRRCWEGYRAVNR